MKISIGSDHAGYALKEEIAAFAASLGYDVIDEGTGSADKSVDYPDLCTKVTSRVTSKEAERGILVCGTGIGMSIAANKVHGIYAALCSNEYMARMSRMHNASNVLVLGGRVTGSDLAKEICRVWLETEAEDGRHKARRDKIAALEASEQGRS